MEYVCDIGVSNDGMIVRRSHVREKIVRCRYCRYYVDPEDSDLNPYCTNEFEGTAITPNTNRWVRPNGFCAWGEKKLLTEEAVKVFEEFEQ